MLDLALLRVEVDSSPAPVAWAPPTAWTRINPRDPAGNPINGVKRIHIECGQQSAYGPVEPGEMLLTLDDRNGYLDQSNPTSPIADLLTPGRQLRVVHVRNDGTDVVLMHGTLQRVLTSAAPPFDAELSVVDLVGVMGATETPESLVSYEMRRGVRYPRPSHLFMLRESETTEDVILSDDFTDYEATPVGTPAKGSGKLIPYSAVSGLKGGANANKGGGYITLPLALAPVPPWTYLVVASSGQGGGAVGFSDAGNPASPRLRLGTFLNGSGDAVVEGRVVQADNAIKGVVGATPLDNQIPHMLVMNDTGTTLFVYVDGVSVGSIAHTTPQQPTNALLCAFGATAEFAMECIWRERILADKQALIWEDVQRPWVGQYTDQRLTSLAEMMMSGVPRVYTLGVAAVQCLPVSLRAAPLLDIIRRTVEAADGRMWVERGTLHYSHRQLSAPGPALRLYGTGGVPVADFTMADGTAELVTQARLETEAGVVEVYEDTAASKRHGTRRLAAPGLLPLKSPLDLWSLCERIVHYRSRLQPYTDRISVAVDNPSVSTDGVLATRLYDRIDFARLPRWSSEVVTEQLDVIRYVHDGDAESQTWRTDIFTQPARPQRLRLDAPAAAANNGASTPDTVANSITGDLDLRARFYRNGWPAAFGTIIGKGDFATVASSYRLGMEGNLLWWSWQSPAGISRRGSQVMPPRAGPRPIWVRGTYVQATGVGSIYTSEDGNDWRLLGTVPGVAGELIRDVTAALNVGVNAPVMDNPLNGKVLYAEIRNGIDGPVAARFDPNESLGVSPWVASTGENWTVRSAAALEAW